MKIKVRQVQPEDVHGIWEIRNESQARAITASPKIVPIAQHIAWFDDKYFTNKNNVCFVAKVGQHITGYCRFDLEQDDHYLISIAVTSSMHGKGIGTFLLQQSIEQLKSALPIIAEVRKFNTVSIKMFEGAGFKKISEDSQNIYYQL